MPRVHEIAKELGLTSRQVIDELNALGHPVTSHSSSVGDEAVEGLRERLGNGGRTRKVSLAEIGEAEEAKAGERVEEEESGDTQVIDTGRVESDADEVREDEGRAVEADEPVRESAPEDDGAATSVVPPLPVREPEKRPRSWATRQLIELPLLIGLAFLIAIVIKTFVAQAFYIPSPSMRPTLVQGDRVLVEKISYRFTNPDRGDVVVFAKEVFGAPTDFPWHQDARNFLRELLGLPTGAEEDYIKRIVAIGGDVVRYAGTPRELVVNGQPVDEPYVRGGRDRSSQTLRANDCERLDMHPQDGGCIVPAGRVFMMGDNRGNSEDSRVIGPVEESKIVGRAFVVIWPFGNWGGL